MINRWVMLVIWVLTLGYFGLVQSLLYFHIWISCCARITTVDYLNGWSRAPRMKRSYTAESAI